MIRIIHSATYKNRSKHIAQVSDEDGVVIGMRRVGVRTITHYTSDARFMRLVKRLEELWS